MNNIRIGINPLTWTNDDLPALGSETPLETCLKEAAEAGYEGIELGNKFPRDPKVLAPLLERYGLSLVSGWYSGNLIERSIEQEKESILPHLELLAAMGCKAVVFCDVHNAIHGDMGRSLSLRPKITAAQWDMFCNKLSKVGDYIQSMGLEMAYHHHMGTLIQSAADVDRMMKHTEDSVGLLVDTGHATFAGDNPFRLLDKWHKRVTHVHCKDVRGFVLKDAVNRDRPFLKAVLDGVYTVPGDGDIDYNKFIKALKDYDYKGWIVVEAEQDPMVAPSFAFAKKGYETLSDALHSQS